MSTFPELVSYLKRTAQNAGWDMTVNTLLVQKMVLAVAVAESELAYRGLDYNDPAFDAHVAAHIDTLDAYRKATGR